MQHATQVTPKFSPSYDLKCVCVCVRNAVEFSRTSQQDQSVSFSAGFDGRSILRFGDAKELVLSIIIFIIFVFNPGVISCI